MSHEVVLERIYTIPFYPKLNSIPRTKRATRAMRMIRAYLSRHMKSDEILIAGEVNEFIFSRGMQKPPRRITVLAKKSDDDVIEVFLADTALEGFDELGDIPAKVDKTEEFVDEDEFEEEDEE